MEVTLKEHNFLTFDEWEYFIHQLGIKDNPKSISDITLNITLDNIIVTLKDELT